MSKGWNIVSRIVKDADGTAFCPSCGCCLEDERSLEHLRMFHAFIRNCFESWPEECTFLPDNQEHLRAFLLVKARHRQPHHVFKFANRREMQIVQGFLDEEMRADRARGVYGWPVIVDGGIAILRPASIAIHGPKAISQKRFNEVSEAVFKVAYDYAGLDFDAWKNASRWREEKAA